VAALFYSVQFYGELKWAIFADAQKVKGFKAMQLLGLTGWTRAKARDRLDW
jgi:hypothetical protein